MAIIENRQRDRGGRLGEGSRAGRLHRVRRGAHVAPEAAKHVRAGHPRRDVALPEQFLDGLQQSARAPGRHRPVEPRQLTTQHLAAGERARRLGLIPGGWRDAALDRQMGEDGGHLARAEFSGVAPAVKVDEAAHPVGATSPVRIEQR
jgi:hypothetical protein